LSKSIVDPSGVTLTNSVSEIPETLRILLVDDHPPVRLAMRILISQTYPNTDVAEASTAADALRQLQHSEFDLVFLDLEIPNSESEPAPLLEVGRNTLKAIRDHDGPPVVIMSALRDRATIEEMMELGAATFVPKSAAVDVSLEAIRRALLGGVWLPPEVLGLEGAPPTAKPVTHTELGITPRQFEILQLALTGRTPARIAAVLGINHDNVRRHMCRLYERFGTANQTSLLAHFAKTGETLGILRAPTTVQKQLQR
jgi:DNA-binding NarL/FixJ family response regulator